MKFVRARVINYPSMVVSRIHDHEPSFYIRAPTIFDRLGGDLAGTVLAIREPKIPVEPFVTEKGETFASGFVKIHSDLQGQLPIAVSLLLVR